MQENAFTVDVEDYFQVSAFEGDIPRSRWKTYESRVQANTEALLELLERHQVQGTFFILGWVAEQYPKLVRKIAAAGHEIGSHSYAHRLIFEMTRNEFRADLRRSKQVLEDILGRNITTFRAPSFSITRKSLWALEILVQEGFAHDSSIFPVYHDRYGIPGARSDIHAIVTPSGTLWEFPPAVHSVFGLRIPVSGGGYFRLYPWRFSEHCLSRVNQVQRPFVFYVHPWEVDPAQPRLRSGTLTSRWRHRVNLGTTMAKLEKLLGRFRFSTMEQVVKRAAAAPQPAIVDLAAVI